MPGGAFRLPADPIRQSWWASRAAERVLVSASYATSARRKPSTNVLPPASGFQSAPPDNGEAIRKGRHRI